MDYLLNESHHQTEAFIHSPDPLLQEGYEMAARRNVLAALNPDVFFGYFAVCADAEGHGHNTTFPGLDWGQSCEALLWLGRLPEVLASWDYVRNFQRADGLMPFAIIPDIAGKTVEAAYGYSLTAETNGAVYKHWVPGDPFRTLANVTFIQMADAIYRRTLDSDWLREQWPYLQRAGEYLIGMVTPDGLVGGGGFYLERPTRLEYDGVNQCYSKHTFELLAELSECTGEESTNTDFISQCRQIATKIGECFRQRFWNEEHCVEYIHPLNGAISHHGLTDVDWSAVATVILDAAQLQKLWPQLRNEDGFVYDGMPTGIATLPESYEDWEMQNTDRHDLAAMGRVWYLESWARAQMGDPTGLLASLSRVLERGQIGDWYWSERYYSERTGQVGIYHISKYCEYPATLIRVVQRFILGVHFELDGTLSLAPCVIDEWWQAGFGQTLRWRARVLDYRISDKGMSGFWQGPQQKIQVRWPCCLAHSTLHAECDGQAITIEVDRDGLSFTLPSTPMDGANPVSFAVSFSAE